MKTLLILTVLIGTFLFSSCVNQRGAIIVDDNCLLYKMVGEDRVYHAGACLDDDGKVDHLKFRWENVNGTKLRATISVKTKGVYTVEYWMSDADNPKQGIWVGWSSKSGIMLGLAPPEVAEAVNNVT